MDRESLEKILDIYYITDSPMAKDPIDEILSLHKKEMDRVLEPIRSIDNMLNKSPEGCSVGGSPTARYEAINNAITQTLKEADK